MMNTASAAAPVVAQVCGGGGSGGKPVWGTYKAKKVVTTLYR